MNDLELVNSQIQKVSEIAFQYMTAKEVAWQKAETLAAFRESGRQTFLALFHSLDGERRRIDQDIGEISPHFSEIAEIRQRNGDFKWNGLRIFTFNDGRFETEFISDPNFEDDVIDRTWDEIDI